MKYNKLVRDKIPEIIRAKGQEPVTHIAGEEEYWAKLKEKLLEEVDELQKDENTEEIADVLEVLEAIAVFKGFDWSEIKKIQEKKASERGKFEKRIILEEA